MKNETIKINGSEYAPRVIFDNAGGTIVQVPGYCCHYSDPDEAAEDVAEWIKKQHLGAGYTNEEDAEIDPLEDDVRNGCYTIWTIGDDYDEFLDSGYYNIGRFFPALNYYTK